mmetsp:Transcript_12651/g.23472  ORF Transcript_12651/g.23472 Transcript_12651/m.23472 type:complete len:633 (-) Transcript_12651:207-2105(-)
MGAGYEFARFVMTSALHVFFSNGVEVVGQENIPKKGPVIFVCGPHSNQFIDSLAVMKAVGGRSGNNLCSKRTGVVRSPGFIIAEVSWRKRIIGDFAKLLNSVPVTRPQDKAVPGSGTISIDLEALTVRGVDSKFTKDCAEKGCSISIKGVGTFVVKEVLNDTKLLIKKPLEEPTVAELKSSNKYKVVPKIPQDQVFEAVYQRLLDNGSIAIFPEGGSHDQTEMLPLKAGVSLMGLGAAARGAPVQIVALGINYFNAHVFRSNAFVDVSRPITIRPEVLEQFMRGEKREACDDLLTEIRDLLKSVTLHAPTYDILKAVRTARRMYQNGIKLSTADYVKLSNRFVRGNETWLEQQDPEYLALLADLLSYLKICWAQGLTDKQVRDLKPYGKLTTVCKAWLSIFSTLLYFVIVAPFAVPGFILLLPVVFRVRRVVRKQMKKALAGSSVKIAARDVAASQKLIVGATTSIACMTVYTTVAIVLMERFLRKDVPSGSQFEIVFVHGWWIFPLVFLFAFPLYIYYFVVQVGESCIKRVKNLHAQFITAMSFCGSSRKNPAEALRQDRKILVLRVQDFVEKKVKDFPEWAQNRVISPIQISNRRSDATLKLLESGDMTPKIVGSNSTVASLGPASDRSA